VSPVSPGMPPWAGRWRGVIGEYGDRLPVAAGAPVVTLGEGGTPLLPAPVLSAMTRCDVYLKVEGANPTGSFKDRGMTVAVSVAAAILVDRHGEQQDHAARRLLVEGRHVHQAHAVVEAAHQQRTRQRAQHPPLSAGQRGAADDRGSDSVELQEQSRAACHRAAHASGQGDSSDPVAEAGHQKVLKDRPLDVDAGQARRLRVPADGIEPDPVARAAHRDLGHTGTDGDKQHQVRHALP